MISKNNSMTTDTTYCRKVLFATISLTIIIFIIYSNSLDCSWHFDDEHSITNNPNIHMEKLSWKNIQKAFHSDQNYPQKIYRPISCLSFALNYYFGELNVFGYHLINIIIHIVTSIFLFLFIYQMFDLPVLKDRYAGKAYFIALLATVMWAITPIQSQAITYIVQRMASMTGMFYIMSMYFYLRARNAQASPKIFIFLFLSFVSFFLSLGSKENAVMLPFSLLIIEILFLQRKPILKTRKGILIFLVSLSALLLAGLVYIFFKDVNIFDSIFSGYKTRPFTLTQRLLTEPRILIFYVSQIIYPVSTRLSIAHDFDVSTSLFTPLSTFFSILLILLVIGFSIYKRKNYPLLAFAVFFFFLNHLIESTILPLELVFEHRNYIPSMFFFLPIAAGFSMILDHYKKKRFMKAVIVIFLVLFLIASGHAVFMRNFSWKTDRTLWIDAIEKAPNLARPHHNLGKHYYDYGHTELAFSEYTKALSLKVTNRNNEYFYTYYNIGKMYSDKNDFENAEDYYNKALEINPKFPPIYNNLASIYDKKGDSEKAYEYLKKAYFSYPVEPYTNLNMALYFLKKKKPDIALKHLQLANTPELFSQAQSYMGVAYKQMGRYGMAVICFKKVVGKNPNNILAKLQIADTYLKANHKELAMEQIDDALGLMIRNKTLFTETLNTLRNREGMESILPSYKEIMPLLKESIVIKTNDLNQWMDLLEKDS